MHEEPYFVGSVGAKTIAIASGTMTCRENTNLFVNYKNDYKLMQMILKQESSFLRNMCSHIFSESQLKTWGSHLTMYTSKQSNWAMVQLAYLRIHIYAWVWHTRRVPCNQSSIQQVRQLITTLRVQYGTSKQWK